MQIYIIFTHTGTIVSKTIRLFTRNKYTHVSISLNRELYEMYSFGRKGIRTPLIGGFTTVGKNKGIYKKYNKTICKIYELTVDIPTYSNIENDLNRFILNQNELKYNFLGIFLILFRYPIKRNGHYFCSQFVAEILDLNQIIKFDKHHALIRPQEIEKFNIGNILYEGYLEKFI